MGNEWQELNITRESCRHKEKRQHSKRARSGKKSVMEVLEFAVYISVSPLHMCRQDLFWNPMYGP